MYIHIYNKISSGKVIAYFFRCLILNQTHCHHTLKYEANCSQDWFKPRVILINEYERMTKLILLIYLLSKGAIQCVACVVNSFGIESDFLLSMLQGA